MKHAITALVFGILFFTTIPVLAQRGVGEDVGLSRQRVAPEFVTVAGKIDEVRIAPCEATTGRSIVGVHVILADAERGLLNIHLGPASDLAYLVDVLDEGKPIEALVFRTDNLADDAFIAREVTVGDTTYTLRDETLRPVWAGSQNGNGPGPGPGMGPRGRGDGRGPRS